MDTSIIVAFDNNAPLMQNFIDQMMPFVKGRTDRELILVSDKCKDSDTLAVSRQAAAENNNVVLLEMPAKVGYSRANNAGVDIAKGEYLLFANTDIFPEPDAIDLLRSKFDANFNLGAAQGCLLYPQNGKVMCTGHVFNDYMNHHLYQGRDPKDLPVQIEGPRQAINSAFMMMPAKIYAEMGGMDEFYYNAFDGMDLTLRVGHAAYDVMYFPDVVAWHSTGGSRDYIRHNNEYQAKYFYTQQGHDITSDLASYLMQQLATLELADEYKAIDCTFCATWKTLMETLGINFTDTYEIGERDSSKIDLYRNLPPEIKNDERPLLFVVNHFNDVTANKRWFSERANKGGDLIIDFFGNVFTTSQLGL